VIFRDLIHVFVTCVQWNSKCKCAKGFR
jgi:hypothetical protein